MPVTMPTLAMVASDSQLRMLLLAFMKKDNSDEQFDFYFSTDSNEIKFNKFIRCGAPREINLDYRVKNQLRNLARTGQWSAMDAPLKQAKDQIAASITNYVLGPFRYTPEYNRWHVAKHRELTDEGVITFNLLKLDLSKAENEATLKALMFVVESGRTPADRKAAFKKIDKLLKFRAKAVNYFRTAGLAVP